MDIHTFFPVFPGAREHADEEACGAVLGVVQVSAVFDQAVFDPTHLGVAGGVILGVERDWIVVGFEYSVTDYEAFAWAEVYSVFHPFDVDVFHGRAFEGADLDTEVVSGQIKHCEVVDIQVFDIEECHLAGEADYRGDVGALVKAVAADVDAGNRNPFVPFSCQGASVKEYVSCADAFGVEGFA